MKIAIIGAGAIGIERIEALRAIQKLTSSNIDISIIVDNNIENLKKLPNKFKYKKSTNIDDALKISPDWVFICTPHDVAVSVAILSLRNGCNVLIEKPLGRSIEESEKILSARFNGKKLFCGFNYRFYSGICAAISDINVGKFGKLISVNLILGHGNSPGMEHSWKLNPSKCGGGALIDPGIHLLDLVTCIAEGELSVMGGNFWNGFWQTGIEEEVHLILKDENDVSFNIQSSLNRWRSSFKLEINGVDGYGVVNGRGKSYGSQTYRVGKRWGWISASNQEKSEIVVVDNDPAIDSFLYETAAVLEVNIPRKNIPSHSIQLLPCSGEQALEVMLLLQKCQEKLGIKYNFNLI